MGRYYNGDIEGKFWVGVQPSDAAARFGGRNYEPSYIEYYFDDQDLPKLKEELDAIEQSDSFTNTKEFFENRLVYGDVEAKEHNVSDEDIREYADYSMGVKIRDCIKNKGHCQFSAEL
jgi:hypothetical protein